MTTQIARYEVRSRETITGLPWKSVWRFSPDVCSILTVISRGNERSANLKKTLRWYTTSFPKSMSEWQERDLFVLLFGKRDKVLPIDFVRQSIYRQELYPTLIGGLTTALESVSNELTHQRELLKLTKNQFQLAHPDLFPKPAPKGKGRATDNMGYSRMSETSYAQSGRVTPNLSSSLYEE